jgi:hypothetical protein
MSVAWFDGVTLTIEVGFASNPQVSMASTVWTEITSFVRGFQTKRGRSSELDTFQAGTCTMTLSNRDRRFDPNYTTGPYFGNLLPMRRVRIRATYSGTTYNMWSGFVDDWPQEYDVGNRDASVTVGCTDGFGVLARLRLPDSVYTIEVAADTPAAWWRLGEQSGTVTLDSSGNGHDGVYRGGAVFGTRIGLVYGSSDNAIEFDGVDDYAEVPPVVTGFPFTVEGWISWSSGASQQPTIYAQQTFSEDAQLNVRGLTTGAIVASIGTGFTNLTPVVMQQAFSNATTYGDGQPHHVAAVFNNGSTPPDLWVDGVLVGTATVDIGTVVWPGTIGMFGSIGLYGLPTVITGGLVDESAVYLSALSGARIAAHYEAGATPWIGDLPGVRVQSLAAVAGWSDVTVSSGTSLMGSASLDSAPMLGKLQDCEAAEQGQLYMGADGFLVFRGRSFRYTDSQSTTSQATFGDGPGEMLYSDIVTDGGAPFIVNRVRASRDGGSAIDVADATSIAKFYEHTEEISGLQLLYDEDARQLANWRLLTHKNPIQRVTELEIRPRAAPASLFPKVLGLDIGQRVIVKRRPQAVGTVLAYTVLIEGVDHTVNPDGTWVVRWYLSSADAQSAFQVLILDDVTAGLLDANVLAF